MAKKTERVVVFICSQKKTRRSSIKQYANLVLALDNFRENKEVVLNEINKGDLTCAVLENYKDNRNTVKVIESGAFEPCNGSDTWNEMAHGTRAILYFRVFEEGGSNDRFAADELIPFALYRARQKQECILVIRPNAGEKLSGEQLQSVSHSISRYMYYESLCHQKLWKYKDGRYECGKSQKHSLLNDYFEQCFIYADGKTNGLMRSFDKKNTMANTLPVIRINKTSYRIMSQSVEECFGTKGKFIACCEEYDFFQELGARVANKQVWAKENTYVVENQETYEEDLIDVMFQSICTNSLKEVCESMGQKSIDLIYELCRQMSMLAFLFLTSFCRTAKKTISQNLFSHLTHLSQDYAEGILQLIENAKEYADVGYIKFRIIDSEGKEGKAWENHYKDYFEQNKEIQYHLQVQITDISQNDIVSSFAKLHGEKYTELELRDFFVPLSENTNNRLSGYYKNISNVALHYGIRHFVSVANAEKGCFEVISSNNARPDTHSTYSNYDCHEECMEHISGTEYKILLPMKVNTKKTEQKSVGFGAKVDYEDISIKDGWKSETIEYYYFIEEHAWLKDIPEDQGNKVTKIEQLAGCLTNKMKGERKILCLNVDKINQMWQIEILTKSIFLYVARSNNDQRIALYNASRQFLMNFTRYICSFYNNIVFLDHADAMSETQIYVCKDDYGVDLGFKGSHLSDAYNVCDYLARTRGVFNDCLDLIQMALNDKEIDQKTTGGTVGFAPFDLLIEVDNECLFEKRVANDLQRDIQEQSFGCCLNDAHMRVGSKVHITDKFFDATLLFASGYYTSRFAYLLAKKISEKCTKKQEKITLVGYENYSELLLAEMQRFLSEKYGMKHVDYIIFEQGKQNDFKYLNDRREYDKKRKFVVVVPVGCTLTTHSKIEAEIKKQISEDADIILNLGAILIRSNPESKKEQRVWDKEPTVLERKYWESINMTDRYVTTRITVPKEIYYNVLVSNKWENPLKCKACFPDKDMTLEKPMLTMSYTSVIPMILVGLKNKRRLSLAISENLKLRNALEKLNEKSGSIEMLKDSLVYGHTENGSNHFEYYFETELLMKKIYDESMPEFSAWLKQLKNVVKLQNDEIRDKTECGQYIYDILVAPMNRTNATFVEYINRETFGNVPIIVNIDANREFRDNIKTKYSNLTVLYNNLMEADKKAVINFYYVDDCIISGTTFYRTKSLLQSLFPTEAFSMDNTVYVNVFQSVILMMNRCSNSTKLNYAGYNHFFSFIDVHISSMRTHHDKACVLCENVNSYRLLRNCSSTNEMAKEWSRKYRKHSVKTIEKSKIVYSDINNGAELKNRHYRRLHCANEFARRLDLLENKKNNTEAVKELVFVLIREKMMNGDTIEDLTEDIEWIISYLKVIARPFPVFRKSTLEAVFSILIDILENWNEKIDDDNIILSIIQKSMQYVKSDSCPKEFLLRVEGLYRSIVALLSSLGAKYLIRKDTYEKLLTNNPISSTKGTTENTEGKMMDFELFYSVNIKRMIVLNKDETIGIWFDYLLVNGCEYGSDDENGTGFVKKFGISTPFGRRLFLENTYIIFQTVFSIYDKCKKDLKEKPESAKKVIEEKIKDFKEAYYYETYRQLFLLVSDENQNVDLRAELIQMVMMFALLSEDNENEKNVVSYYGDLAEQMQRISDAHSVGIYGCSPLEGKNAVYEIAQSGNVKQEVYKQIIKDAEANLRETLTINEKQGFVLIKIDCNSELVDEIYLEDQKYSDNVYFIFEYNSGLSKDDYNILRKIRNILAFRHAMVKRFQRDFHNDAFRVLIEQKHQNELLVSQKAVSHTSNETLHYVTAEMKNGNNDKYVYAAYALQLAADSLISRLYVDVIKESDPIREDIVITKFTFDDSLIRILESLRFYSDGDEIAQGEYTGLKIENHVTSPVRWEIVSGQLHYRMLFVVAILHNALKHGLAEEERKVYVKIYSERKEKIDYLCFENRSRFSGKKEEYNRGITVKAIRHYFKKYLNRDVLDDVFIDENGKASYIIKLPLTEEKEV